MPSVSVVSVRESPRFKGNLGMGAMELPWLGEPSLLEESPLPISPGVADLYGGHDEHAFGHSGCGVKVGWAPSDPSSGQFPQ